jgi:hypothetical protein
MLRAAQQVRLLTQRNRDAGHRMTREVRLPKGTQSRRSRADDVRDLLDVDGN